MNPHHDDHSTNSHHESVHDDEHQVLAELVGTAFGHRRQAGGPDSDRPPGGVAITGIADANRGGGVFSRVFRLELATTGDLGHPPVPSSTVAKLPARDANRLAAARSGAYRREAHCYRELLVDDERPVAEAHAVIEHADGSASLLLQDLTSFRWPEPLSGLQPQDAASVVSALARFHQRWRHDIDRSGERHPALVDVRANAVAGLDHGSLVNGLRTVQQRWAGELSQQQLAAMDMIVGRHDDVAAAFGSHRSVTLCHGDPRAANLAFDHDGSAILVDWQQVARQFGEADVAWLCATSLTSTRRRQLEHDLVEEYGGDPDRYRLGLALPAMAVLLLAQRHVDSARTATLITTSLDRIATAVVDNW